MRSTMRSLRCWLRRTSIGSHCASNPEATTRSMYCPAGTSRMLKAPPASVLAAAIAIRRASRMETAAEGTGAEVASTTTPPTDAAGAGRTDSNKRSTDFPLLRGCQELSITTTDGGPCWPCGARFSICGPGRPVTRIGNPGGQAKRPAPRPGQHFGRVGFWRACNGDHSCRRAAAEAAVARRSACSTRFVQRLLSLAATSVGAASGLKPKAHRWFSSSSAIFRTRRRWRSSPLNRADTNARTSSVASSRPMTRAPRQSTFMSSCSTPWRAE